MWRRLDDGAFMIEFKAECGHTVRAKDEDAGGTVRCSYCGRLAAVPENNSGGLDFLFTDMEPGAGPPAAAGKVAPRGIAAMFARWRRGRVDPFAIVLRLCWAALLISVVVVVTRMFVLPQFQKQGPGRDGAAANPPLVQAPAEKKQRNVEKGEISREKLSGMYVTSTPPGASVFCANASDAPAKGRIHRSKGCTQFKAQGESPRVPDGVYVVETVFAWNDPVLKQYSGYSELRRKIETAPEAQRNQLVEEYFLPDEAAAVFVDQTDEQRYIVRQYRNVEVRDGRSPGVRALFLPRLSGGAGGSFSIEALLSANYLPEKITYTFDESHVRSELDYYQVQAADQPFVLMALARIGVIPYRTADHRTILFKIGIEDGGFLARVLRDPNK